MSFLNIFLERNRSGLFESRGCGERGPLPLSAAGGGQAGACSALEEVGSPPALRLQLGFNPTPRGPRG